MSPAETPTPFRFVLLCHQRSGSNALGAILNADERIWIYGQLFNPFWEYWRRNRRALGFGPFRAHPEALRHFGRRPPLKPRLERAAVGLLRHETSLDRRMAAFWDRYRAREAPLAKGFKLHDFQLDDADLADLARRHADGVVLLSRRNLLKAAVSWAYAIKTDVWSARGPLARQPVHRLDPEEIGWFVDKTRAEVAGWRRKLDAAGANWIELVYEDHVAPRALEGLYAFLGVPWRGRPEFKTERLSRPDYGHVANARDLDRRFGSDETGRLFG